MGVKDSWQQHRSRIGHDSDTQQYLDDCRSKHSGNYCMSTADLTWMCLKRMLVLRGLPGSDSGTSAGGTYIRLKLSQAVLLGFTAFARAVRKSFMVTHPKVCLPPIVTLNRSTCIRKHVLAKVLSL